MAGRQVTTCELFPNFGSHHNPLITGLVTLLAAVVVFVFWGPRTLVGGG
jgi:hypothetical protein